MTKYLLALTALVILGCAPSSGTSTGNPMVNLKINSYNSTLAVQKPNFEAAAVDNLKFCFKRLRFKQSGENTDSDPSVDSDNIDFYLGEVDISSLGTNLTGVTLQPGTYTRIEFDLEANCPSGKSLQLTNANGSFSTEDRITIKFEGDFTHTAAGETLGLGVQQIVSALNTVTSSSEIKAKAEEANGDF